MQTHLPGRLRKVQNLAGFAFGIAYIRSLPKPRCRAGNASSMQLSAQDGLKWNDYLMVAIPVPLLARRRPQRSSNSARMSNRHQEARF